MRVVEIPHGALGFDCFVPLGAAQYRAMRTLGFLFVTRYLDNMSRVELSAALGEGFLVNLISAAPSPQSWTPGSDVGSAVGMRARHLAIALGVPPAMNLWRDLETPSATTTVTDIQLDARAYCTELAAGGYVGKVYVGSGLPRELDAYALYGLAYKGYWESFSQVPGIAVRGYELRQLFHYPSGDCAVRDAFPGAPESVASVRIDIDVAHFDYRGDRCKALSA